MSPPSANSSIPIADKLIVMAALIMILPFDRVPAWMVLVILGREIIITGLSGIASTEGIVIPASNLGKFKTIFQIVAILGLLLHYDYHWFFAIDHPYLMSTCTMSACSISGLPSSSRSGPASTTCESSLRC